jgi:flavin reductase (DIM6/NTAB) family NADH-FMN oxidoreductase RutF
MARIEVDYRDYFKPIAESLRHGGLLLVTQGARSKPNPITIGWASLGPMWGRPVFTAMIRHSRYSFELLEEGGDFTVNLMPGGMSAALGFCGSKSGRDVDKLAKVGLTPVASSHVASPGIEEAALILECVVVEKVDMAPETLSRAILASAYADGDFHRFYFGEILGAYADDALIAGR